VQDIALSEVVGSLSYALDITEGIGTRRTPAEQSLNVRIGIASETTAIPHPAR